MVITLELLFREKNSSKKERENILDLAIRDFAFENHRVYSPIKEMINILSNQSKETFGEKRAFYFQKIHLSQC